MHPSTRATPPRTTIPLTEHLISLGEAGASVPSRHQGKRVNASTVWRWCRKGLRATDGRMIYLGHVRVGGHFVTSTEALERFFADLNPPPQTNSTSRTTRRGRETDAKEASKELDRIGV